MDRKCLPPPVTGPWTLKQLHHGDIGSPKNGLKVLSTFSCGGGSSMGYKLAGFDVVGCVEIDAQMLDVYRHNLNPKHPFLMTIQEFNQIATKTLPEDIRSIDVLDGSPPCSVFSMAGKREDDWARERMFKEGQAVQVLDDLFFHFIETAKKLQPKVVIAENVTGLIKGNARGYVKEIFAGFDRAGYRTRFFQLNSSCMGVPQSRPRVFFVAERKDLKPLNYDMNFSEPEIILSEAWKGLPDGPFPELELARSSKIRRHWTKSVPGGSLEQAAGKNSNFTNFRLSYRKVAQTLTSTSSYLHPTECRNLTDIEVCRIQSFPDDYWFPKRSRKFSQYICGMSVPPLMMQRIALRIAAALLE